MDVSAGVDCLATVWRGRRSGRSDEEPHPPLPSCPPPRPDYRIHGCSDQPTSCDRVPPCAPAPAELDELLRMQALRGAHTNNQIRRWGMGAGVLPWTAVALDLVKRTRRNPVRAGRALALVHAAMADAVVAAWDAKDAYPRPRPAELEPGLLQQGVIVRGLSTFPSEHAAIAGAAATVLTYLFPEEPAERIAGQATEAANSRMFAGANYRSDMEAGLALGRAIGERAVARGRSDGSGRGVGRQRAAGGRLLLAAGAAALHRGPPRSAGRPLEALGAAQR